MRLAAAAASCGFALALADTGSEQLDFQVAQLQQQIGARQQLSEDLLNDELALGYSVPEIVSRQDETMVAKANDDAFTQAMIHLRKTITMFALLD
jgi:hypothetical protein